MRKEFTKGENEMKKRTLGIVMIALLLFSCIACGEQEDSENKEKKQGINVVEIGGKKYDFSEDVKDVIKEMVKDKIVVAHTRTLNIFGKNGRYEMSMREYQKEGKKAELFVGVDENLVSIHGESNIVMTQYELGIQKVSFVTADGIANDSTVDDLKTLEGYVPYMGTEGGTAYAAVYVDGARVDLTAYETQLNVLLGTKEEQGLTMAVQEHLTESAYYPKNFSMFLQMASEKPEEVLEGSLLIALAVQEAGEKLEKEDIENYDIVVYEHVKDEMKLHYYHHFYEEDWDQTKFQQK